MNHYPIYFLLFSLVSFDLLANCQKWDKWAPKRTVERICFEGFSVDHRSSKEWPDQVRYAVNHHSELLPIFDRREPSESQENSLNVVIKATHQQGFDYGHLVSETLSHISFDQASHKEVRAPLSKTINRILMPKLEAFEVASARKKGDLIVVNGTIGSSTLNGIYKILIHQQSQAAIAFLIPNTEDAPQDLNHYITSIVCIEKAVGKPVVNNLNNYTGWKSKPAFSLDVWYQGDKAGEGICQK